MTVISYNIYGHIITFLMLEISGVFLIQIPFDSVQNMCNIKLRLSFSDRQDYISGL